MNRILVVCLLVLGMQPAAAAANGASFAGTWKGTLNDLPGVDLTILESAAKFSGSVVFYFQERADVNSPWRVTGEYAVPLLKPHVDGQSLTFEIEHHVCHGCAELGPNVVFRMELSGTNEARLTRFAEDGTEGTQMKLVRSNDGSTQVAPPLQHGISVEMPATMNASPMPEADQPDALILTVTVDGKVYLGIQPIDSEALAARLQATKGAGKRLYIKADSRAPYATVVHALDAASEAGIETTVLLTSQRDLPQPAAVAPPNGIPVETGGCHCVARAKLSL
jgi:biopolymer transport protein ExbD